MWGVAYQLADLCRLITLEPGDVVLTGTPANSRPMEPGDVVAVEIGGLGRLENTVVDWDVDLTGPASRWRSPPTRCTSPSPSPRTKPSAWPGEQRMKVHVDMNLCQSHGECVMPAPDVFDLGDDDVLVWKEDVPEERRAAVEAAIDACPMMAIRIKD